MKFDKAEKRGAKQPGGKKRLIIEIAVGVIVLAVIILPMALGGLK